MTIVMTPTGAWTTQNAPKNPRARARDRFEFYKRHLTRKSRYARRGSLPVPETIGAGRETRHLARHPGGCYDNAIVHATAEIANDAVPLTLEMKRMAPTETNTWYGSVFKEST